MMHAPEGEECAECGGFLSLDFEIWEHFTRDAAAYYSCENPACDNYGVVDFIMD